jgi:hypothetical protein
MGGIIIFGIIQNHPHGAAALFAPAYLDLHDHLDPIKKIPPAGSNGINPDPIIADHLKLDSYSPFIFTYETRRTL